MSQVYFEDVEPGDQIGPRIKQPSVEETRAFAELSRLSGRFVSADGAREEGAERMLVSSWQSMGYLAQLIADWMGQHGFLSRFDVYFRRRVEPEDRLECQAVITDTTVAGERGVVTLDAFIVNQRGERPLQATAEVVLPSRYGQ
jgi:acyl dehydratase